MCWGGEWRVVWGGDKESWEKVGEEGAVLLGELGRDRFACHAVRVVVLFVVGVRAGHGIGRERGEMVAAAMRGVTVVWVVT